MRTIRVLVKYSGLLSEAIGRTLDVLEVSQGTTLEELLEKLAAGNPALGKWLSASPSIILLINGSEVLNPSRIVLRDGDEITLMPPLYEGG